jgi:hypothetical protein
MAAAAEVSVPTILPWATDERTYVTYAALASSGSSRSLRRTSHHW